MVTAKLENTLIDLDEDEEVKEMIDDEGVEVTEADEEPRRRRHGRRRS